MLIQRERERERERNRDERQKGIGVPETRFQLTRDASSLYYLLLPALLVRLPVRVGT